MCERGERATRRPRHGSRRPIRSTCSGIGDPKGRQDRQLHELDRHNQQLLVASPDVRREFMKKLDTSSIAAYTKSIEPYRTFFADEVIGRFDLERLPPECPHAPDL